MVRKVLLRGGALATAVVGAIAVIGRDTPPGRALRHVGEVAGRRTRDLRNRFEGVRYRLSGRSPDPTVTDDVLADRVRSSLGPLVKRLDVPHPHVMVERHVVLLHGEVSARADADALEAAVARVPGVLGVESFLHVGLVPGDTRPSQGRAEHRASPALRRLVRAAEEAGASRVGAVPAVRAVLGAFADRLPAGELDHLLAHLPEDVRALAGPPRRTGEIPLDVKTVPELVAAATARGGMRPERAEAIAAAVLGTLRELVPEEAGDVAAVLPEELRRFWATAVPS